MLIDYSSFIKEKINVPIHIYIIIYLSSMQRESQWMQDNDEKCAGCENYNIKGRKKKTYSPCQKNIKINYI